VSDDLGQQERRWGGYRHGRKRQSSIRVVALHTSVKIETHTALKERAEREQLTMGEILDRLLRKPEPF
jgi:predicted DNA-binding ribbon-helix-helix protein